MVSASAEPLTTLSISAADLQEVGFARGQLGKADQGRKARQRDCEDERRRGSTSKDTGICPCTGLLIVKDYEQTDQDKETIMMAVKNNKVLGEVLQLSNQ